VKRFAVSALVTPIIVIAFVLARPTAVQPFQSPAATPIATRAEATLPVSPLATPDPTGGSGPPVTAPAISPLIWIAAGLLLGGAIVLIARRASPHDR